MLYVKFKEGHNVEPQTRKGKRKRKQQKKIFGTEGTNSELSRKHDTQTQSWFMFYKYTKREKIAQ